MSEEEKEPVMKAEKKQPGGSGSFGTLLSLFGRKLKIGGEKPVVSVEATPVEPQVPLSLFANGRRILIADDDEVFCQATENKLRMSGFEVCRATEGSSVIQAARSQAPDVILLDLEFPAELPTSWDGFSIMDWLNQVNWFPNTPIIICTGSNAPDLVERATVARAAGVLHKPLDYGQLLGLIEGQLASRGSGNN